MLSGVSRRTSPPRQAPSWRDLALSLVASRSPAPTEAGNRIRRETVVDLASLTEKMSRRRSVWLIAGGGGAFVGAPAVCGASAAPPATADATAVTQWNLIAVSTITGVPGPGLPGPAGGAPPASQINMGMAQGAVYGAVNAITPKHPRPYLLNRRFGNRASDEAAVATAAYLVLKNIVETVPQSITFPNRETPLAALASQYQAATNAIPDSPFKKRGIAAGTAAAQAMIDARLKA